MMPHDVLDIIRNGQIPFANPLDDTVNPPLGLYAEIGAASSLEGCRVQKGFPEFGLDSTSFRGDWSRRHYFLHSGDFLGKNNPDRFLVRNLLDLFDGTQVFFLIPNDCFRLGIFLWQGFLPFSSNEEENETQDKKKDTCKDEQGCCPIG